MGPVTQVETIARTGYFARGIVYVLLGYFALTTRGVAEEGTTGLFQQIREAPAGTILLVPLAVGLAAYGIFRLYTAVIDLDLSGKGWKEKGKRIGHFASGLAHMGLAAGAVMLAFGGKAQQGGDQQEKAQMVLDLPFGDVLLGIVGIGFLLAALEQAKNAWTAKFVYQMAADTPAFAKPVGRMGYGARSVVFVIIGIAIIRAAWFHHSSEVKGLGGALSELSQHDLLYSIIAAGLALFGIFSLIYGKYRRIRNDDVIEKLKSIAPG